MRQTNMTNPAQRQRTRLTCKVSTDFSYYITTIWYKHVDYIWHTATSGKHLIWEEESPTLSLILGACKHGKPSPETADPINLHGFEWLLKLHNHNMIQAFRLHLTYSNFWETLIWEEESPNIKPNFRGLTHTRKRETQTTRELILSQTF